MNSLFKNGFILFIQIIFMDLFFLINCNNISLRKINYFKQDINLHYVNAMNSENGDLYMEFSGERTNFRYFIGINSSTEEDIFFGNKTILKIETNSSSTLHESIIIDNNEENNIFSINVPNFDFINIKNEEIISNKIELDYSGKYQISFKNSIIKLNSHKNNYLLSLIMPCKEGLLSIHYYCFSLIGFSFISNNIENYYIIYNENIFSSSDFVNSTTCFQSESMYIQCSTNRPILYNSFSVMIFNLNFTKKATINFNNNFGNNYFSKIFHIKDEIGAYLYFCPEKNNRENVPLIHIKKLNENKNNLENVFSFDYIIINGNQKYILNPGLFFSDAIKINNSKFVVILTSQNLLNLIICLFDLYYDDNYIRLRYFYLNLEISINIRAFKFNNYFGLLFFDPNLGYPGYLIFNYPKIISQNRTNNTVIEIKLFINSTINMFSFSENFELVNNIFEGQEKIKIINYTNKYISGVILNSSFLNSEININDELELNDTIIFQPNKTGAVPGIYILEFIPIVKQIKSKNFSDYTEFYGNYKNAKDNDEEYQVFNEEVYTLIYTVECHEKCKTCSQLYNDSFYNCELCLNEFPYFIINGKKCEENCNNYIFINEEKKYCLENCDIEQFIYNKNENEKYCLSSCFFPNEYLYLEEESNICYKNCSESSNGTLYNYQNKCVLECPNNYIINKNNICIFNENEILTNEIGISYLDNIKTSYLNVIESSYLEKIDNIEVERDNIKFLDEKKNIIDFFDNINIFNDNNFEGKKDLINDIYIINKIENEKFNFNLTDNDFIAKFNDIIFQITSTYNQKYLNYENISNIDLGECEEILKKQYNIDKKKGINYFKNRIFY